jgi:hypothetical protein
MHHFPSPFYSNYSDYQRNWLLRNLRHIRAARPPAGKTFFFFFFMAQLPNIEL